MVAHVISKWSECLTWNITEEEQFGMKLKSNSLANIIWLLLANNLKNVNYTSRLPLIRPWRDMWNWFELSESRIKRCMGDSEYASSSRVCPSHVRCSDGSATAVEQRLLWVETWPCPASQHVLFSSLSAIWCTRLARPITLVTCPPPILSESNLPIFHISVEMYGLLPGPLNRVELNYKSN